MAGKIRHLFSRNGRYYARVVVPGVFAPICRKYRELLQPLGADRTVALRAHSAVVAQFQDQLAKAKRRAELDYLSHCQALGVEINISMR
jgi:hypothetical protein